MAGTKLDGAGAQKMKTLEEALTTLQTIHGHVERMAIEVKNQRGVGIIPQQIKRIATPLQGQLKGQFGMIADQVSGMILAAGRGGGEQLKVRALREYVGQLRQAIEIMQAKVKEQHSVAIESSGDA
jgi:hypothetical protein